MSIITKSYSGTAHSSLTAIQLATVLSQNLFGTIATPVQIEVQFHNIQNCRIDKDPDQRNWNLIWNQGVAKDYTSYISIKILDANTACARSFRGIFDKTYKPNWIHYDHSAYIKGREIILDDDCYFESYGECILSITSVEYDTVENQDVLWQDFTQDDLKDWILDNTTIPDWNHCNNMQLSEIQKTSLEQRIGCTINSSSNVIWLWFERANNPSWWCLCAQTPGETAQDLTFIFPQAVKTKAKQLDNTVTTGYSYAVTAQNVTEINHGDVILNGAYLWENYHNMNTYINKTDTNMSNSATTSGVNQYGTVYLTKLAKYGGNGKQLEFLTNAANAVNTENKTTSGYYYFSQSQAYGGGSSDKYKYWATKGNPNYQVIYEGPNEKIVEIIDDTHFKIKNNSSDVGTIYLKKPHTDVYLFRRTGCTNINVHSYTSCLNVGETSQSETNMMHMMINTTAVLPYNSGHYGCPDPYPQYKSGDSYQGNEILNATISNSKVYYKKNNDQTWTDAASCAIGSVIETSKSLNNTYTWNISGETEEQGVETSAMTGKCNFEYWGYQYSGQQQRSFDWFSKYGVMYRAQNQRATVSTITLQLKFFQLNNGYQLWNGDIDCVRKNTLMFKADDGDSRKRLSVTKRLFINCQYGGIISSVLDVQSFNFWGQRYKSYYSSYDQYTAYFTMEYQYSNAISTQSSTSAYAVVVYNSD